MNSSVVIENISSDYILTDIETPFKITAGPGAGKTHWLIEHIKYVLKNSTKLVPVSKIACITYTNVAVEEIQSRLGTIGDRVEVSTIHSFLYNTIVKHYVHLLKDEKGKYLVNYKDIDGHDDHVPSKGKIHKWKSDNKLYGTVKDDNKLIKCLKDLDWIFEESELVLTTREDYKRKNGRYFIKKDYFFSYKKLFWKEGTIHHEDVLYFTYKILEEYPMLLEFIAARYPYLFIDEFQDTCPLQTKIIKKLANTGVVVGVIGDPAQSIYKFTGAVRQDFLDFELTNQVNFYMNENRRSTNKIINFLNHLRNDDGFEQDNHRNIDGNNICLITGVEPNDIIDKFNQERTKLGFNNTYCLVTRKNESVTALKSILVNCNLNNNLWDVLYSIDPKRYRFLKYIFTALEIAREKRYDRAIKEALKLFKTNQEGYLTEPFKESIIDEKIFKRSYSISLLEYLINNYDEHLDTTLYEFYNVALNKFFVSCNFQLKKLSRGKFKEKAESVTVKELVSSINLKEVKTNEIRTIHKTKGAEFESVLIYFDDEKELDKIINPDINNDEDDYRLYYVALSRAEDFLCIAAKSMEKEQIESCKELNMRML